MDKDIFEPDFDKVAKVSTLSGLLQLENGGETYRAEDTVMRICSAFGCADSEVMAFPTGIIVTLKHNGRIVFSSVQRVKKRTINLNKLNEANNISRALAGGKLTIDDAVTQLEAINRAVPYNKLLYALIAAVSTAFFALLYGGGIFDAVIAFVCGGAVQLISSMMKGGDLYKFAISLLGGAVIALLAVSSTEIFDMGSVDKIIMGAIIPQLPGLAMTTAIRDTMNGDLISGCARLCEVILVAFALAAGVVRVFAGYIALYGNIDYMYSNAAAPVLIVRLIKDLIYAFIASAFFSVLIGTPKKSIVPASILGAFGYIVYDVIINTTGGEVAAFFFGTLLISIVSEILARTMKMPSLIFVIPAIVPLVPGVGIYKTMLYLIVDDFGIAVSTGVTTLLTTGAMAIAIAGASVLVSRIYKIVKK